MNPSVGPTYKRITCLSDDHLLSTCPSYCSISSVETVLIGVEEQECENHDDNEFDSIVLEMHNERHSDNSSCITQQIGCAIPWLCDLITAEGSNASYSRASILLDANTLLCDEEHSHESHHDEVAVVEQYTEFILEQYCCSADKCNVDPVSATRCVLYILHCSLYPPLVFANSSYNEIYTHYNEELYKCLYSKNAVNNKYQKVRQCEHPLDTNNYDDTCEYLISQSFSTLGCQCKSSFLLGHHHEHFLDDIGEWNAQQLEPQKELLIQFGCASNILCAPTEDDEVFVGGLLSIERILYSIEMKVFVSHSNGYTNAIEYIESKIDAEDARRAYITISEEHDADDAHANGTIVDILIVFLDRDKRDALMSSADLFGNGTELLNVSARDINETLQYYGSDRYYVRPERNKEEALIGGIVLALCVGAMSILITCCFLEIRCP